MLKWKSHDRRVVAVVLLVRLPATGFFAGVFNANFRKMEVPSGKLTFCYGNHNFLWENPLFLWPFSIAMLVYQRVPGTNNVLKW